MKFSGILKSIVTYEFTVIVNHGACLLIFHTDSKRAFFRNIIIFHKRREDKWSKFNIEQSQYMFFYYSVKLWLYNSDWSTIEEIHKIHVKNYLSANSLRWAVNNGLTFNSMTCFQLILIIMRYIWQHICEAVLVRKASWFVRWVHTLWKRCHWKWMRLSNFVESFVYHSILHIQYLLRAHDSVTIL